jgi:PQQ system protein
MRGATTIVLIFLAAGCEYGRLLRPRALKQLNPRMVALVNELPEVDQPNKEIVGRLLVHGGLAEADVGGDGLMHVEVRIPPNQFIWEPSVLVMPKPGEMEVQFQNEDQNLHIAFLPSDAQRDALILPVHTAGAMRVKLSQPGLYWFGCPVANHAGRGMLGLIIVRGGEGTPAEAKLDRPHQRQPGD